MFYLLSMGGVHNGVNVTGISNAIKITLDANKNHWLRNSTFYAAKAGMISAAFGYGDTEDGVDMQEQVRLTWEVVGVTDDNQ